MIWVLVALLVASMYWIFCLWVAHVLGAISDYWYAEAPSPEDETPLRERERS